MKGFCSEDAKFCFNNLDEVDEINNFVEIEKALPCLPNTTLRDHNVEKINERDICKICIENEIDCVFIECGHLVSCLKCSENLHVCPFCRQEILKIMKIYRV